MTKFLFTQMIPVFRVFSIRCLFVLCWVGLCLPEATAAPAIQHPEPSKPDVVLPPAWAFGVLYGGYTNQAETLSRVQEIMDHDYPIDAYWIDSWFWNYAEQGRGPKGYLDFVGDTEAYPDMEAMWSSMQDHGIKAGIWVWNCIIQPGNEAAFLEFAEAGQGPDRPHGYFSEVNLNKSTWHNGGQLDVWNVRENGSVCGEIDFEHPAAVDLYHQKLAPFFDKGLDFLKLDRTAALPFCRASFEATQTLGRETKGRGFIFAHSGNASREYDKYPSKWTDDTQIAWTHPSTEWPQGGYRENVENVTMPGKKGHDIPFISCDTGGYSHGRGPAPAKEDEELYLRWVQFGAFLPIMEVFSAYNTPSSNLAWKHSERADRVFRDIAQFRQRLFPYIYSYAHVSRADGVNIVRSDGVNPYQYQFGEEFLVGPVVEPGATTKTFVLPEGNWIDYHTGESFRGGTEATIPAPLDRTPLMVRAGAIIPLRDYARTIEGGSNARLTLQVFPGPDSRFSLYEDDGSSNDYLAGGYSTTHYTCRQSVGALRFEIEPIKGQFEGMLERRSTVLLLPIAQAPKSVELMVDQKVLPTSWEYLPDRAQMRIEIDAATDEKVNVSVDW